MKFRKRFFGLLSIAMCFTVNTFSQEVKEIATSTSEVAQKADTSIKEKYGLSEVRHSLHSGKILWLIGMPEVYPL